MRLFTRATTLTFAAIIATTAIIVPANALTVTPQDDACVVTLDSVESAALGITSLPEDNTTITAEQRETFYSDAVSALTLQDALIIQLEEKLNQARDARDETRYYELDVELVEATQHRDIMRALAAGLEKCAAGDSYGSTTMSSQAEALSSYGIGNLSSDIERALISDMRAGNADFDRYEAVRAITITLAVLAGLGGAAAAAAPHIINFLPAELRAQVEALLP